MGLKTVVIKGDESFKTPVFEEKAFAEAGRVYTKANLNE